MSENGDADRFLLDVMLGKLATYLRMCGYDTAYALDRGIEADEELRPLAESEGRTLLTRDEELATATDDAVLLTEREVEQQLRELRATGVELSLPDHPQRCSACNGEVEPADLDDAPEHVPDGVEPYRCRDCGQWFWRGSHWDDVQETLAAI
ncbi:Mut7-C RNAse domain-containing protein [Halolamina sp. CBA1230]|uniref:Mut7-C RNAse domain-containing protein n=1 Tax=Halolamina sp. CBA1230 TaxID=1853690 RepID=UPI0009A22D8D|nr:Mut7-C RNAse domain-containing protein [Halolamina sp. CBA1230]QKY21366.1 Mut7-C RNAse domain-containing protein [Halolamina sp. CBA1230]